MPKVSAEKKADLLRVDAIMHAEVSAWKKAEKGLLRVEGSCMGQRLRAFHVPTNKN